MTTLIFVYVKKNGTFAFVTYNIYIYAKNKIYTHKP